MRLVLTRLFMNDRQTLGRLSVINNQGIEIFVCKTLELPYIGNKRRISCVPVGKYDLMKRTSYKYHLHFHLWNVPGRDHILIHQGNFHHEILGCILVGMRYKDIDGDKNLDILNSASTLEILLNLLPDRTTITICNDINLNKVSI
jgi:hypothetical protein